MHLKTKVAALLATTIVALGLGVGTASAGTAPQAVKAVSLSVCSSDAINLTWHGDQSFTASLKGDANECVITLDAYAVPATWDGKGFDASASPQALLDSQTVTVTGESQTWTLTGPRCGPAQYDATSTDHAQKTLLYPSGSKGFLAGGLVKGNDCAPPPPSTKHTSFAILTTDETCIAGDGGTTPGSITLVASKHATYTIDGVATAAGTYPEKAGTYTIVATPDKGYTFGKRGHKGKSVTQTVTINPPDGLCTTLVTPVAPKVNAWVCKNGVNSGGGITIATTVGITYTKSTSPIAADAGKVIVTATADKGYTLAPAAGWTVNDSGSETIVVTPLVAGFCATVHKPIPSCAKGSTLNATKTLCVKVPVKIPSTPASSNKTLAFTGMNLAEQGTLATFLLGFGVLCLFAGRRTSTDGQHRKREPLV